MPIQLGEKYLITTDGWFVAPDGERYSAVFGTVVSVHSDEETLGVKTNRGSTNWYVEIGKMLIAGCQVHYAIRTDKVDLKGPRYYAEKDGKLIIQFYDISHIYMAD